MSKLRNKQGMTFQSLVASIRQAHEQCFAHATKAVNVSLTARNWMIGYYIEEYERDGVHGVQSWVTMTRKLSMPMTRFCAIAAIIERRVLIRQPAP